MSEVETVTQTEQQENQPAAEETPKKKGWFSKKEKEKKTPLQELKEWVVTLVAAVLIALVVRQFIFEPVRVDGSSMAETLVNGEVMFVTKPEYIWGDPQRFDVVICHYPGRGNTNFVKRVVGIPGDVVEVKDGYLYVNGEKYEEEYLTYRPNYNYAAYTVPEDMYFVLGDNRSNSNDSHMVGPISRDMIIGHVRSVILPPSAWRTIE